MKVRHHERGTVLVEFALLSTLLLMMIFGILETSRAVYTFHLVSNAARLGARYAIVRGSTCAQTLPGCSAATPDEIQAYVRSISPAIDPNALSVTTTWANGVGCVGGAPNQAAGCIVTVAASYTFQSVLPLLNLTTVPISSQSAMVISQ